MTLIIMIKKKQLWCAALVCYRNTKYVDPGYETLKQYVELWVRNPCYKTNVILRIWFINLTKNYYEHIQLVVIYQTGPLYEHLGWK